MSFCCGGPDSPDVLMNLGDDRTQYRKRLQHEIAQLTEIENTLKRATKHARRTSSYGDKPLLNRLSVRQIRDACVVHALSMCLETAADYLQQHMWMANLSVAGISAPSTDDIRNFIHAHAEAQQPHVQTVIADADHPLHFKAAFFIAERYLYQWLVDCNVKGIAPTTSVCFEHLVVFWPDSSRGDKMQGWFAEAGSQERKREMWARRFRRRWAIKYKKLPQHAPLSDTSISRKAIWFDFVVEFWFLFWFPLLVTFLRLTCGYLDKCYVTRFPLVGPFFAPRFGNHFVCLFSSPGAAIFLLGALDHPPDLRG